MSAYRNAREAELRGGNAQEDARDAALALELENARFRHALELIAYYEAREDECAEAMRQVARNALGKDIP